MKKLIALFVVLAALAAPGISFAQLYPLFGPSNGIMKGSIGTPQTVAAAVADVLALYTGTCSSSTFARGDGACSTALATSGGSTLAFTTSSSSDAAITATSGGSNAQLQLIAQNGHCFNPDNVHGCLWTIDSNGHFKLSSTGTLDTAWAIDLSASTISEDINLGANGTIGINGANTSHAYLGSTGSSMAYWPSNRGATFTATLTGMSATVTATASYSTTYNEHQQNTAFANIACVSIPATTGTSNAATFTVSGIPSVLRPANYPVGGITNVENNGTAVIGAWYYNNGADTLVFANGAAGNESAFTTSGTKGFPANHGFTACWETGNS